MNLVIQILTGTLFHIRVAKDASVADLKKEISNQENLPENHLILMLDTGHGDSIMLNDDENFPCGLWGNRWITFLPVFSTSR